MITITIKTDNAAFGDGQLGYEVARILRQLADLAERDLITDNDGLISVLRDSNGNAVGKAEVYA